jgi:hypothetical protein
MKKTRIKITQNIIPSGYSWLEAIVLVDDKELSRVSDWTVGWYHCKHCNTFQGFSYKVPPEGSHESVNAKAHNERNAFWREHCHGDGMILLIEKDIEIEGDSDGGE